MYSIQQFTRSLGDLCIVSRSLDDLCIVTRSVDDLCIVIRSLSNLCIFTKSVYDLGIVIRSLGDLAPVLQCRHPISNARLVNVKQAQSISDLISVVYPVVSYLGPHLSVNTILIVKLLRIGRAILEKVC